MTPSQEMTPHSLSVSYSPVQSDSSGHPHEHSLVCIPLMHSLQSSHFQFLEQEDVQETETVAEADLVIVGGALELTVTLRVTLVVGHDTF